MHTRQWSRPKKATYGLFTFEFVSDEVIYFYADPDPHQTLHSETNPDPDPDPDPNPDPTQSLAHVGKLNFFDFYCTHSSGSLHSFIFLISVLVV
jgi:hypothetical protein